MRPSSAATNHLTLLLLIAFSASANRDLVPLGTGTATSKDGAHDWLTYSRLLLLSIAGVVVPLISPRQFLPVDPSVSTRFGEVYDRQRSKLIHPCPIVERSDPSTRADRVDPLSRALLLSRLDRPQGLPHPFAYVRGAASAGGLRSRGSPGRYIVPDTRSSRSKWQTTTTSHILWSPLGVS